MTCNVHACIVEFIPFWRIRPVALSQFLIFVALQLGHLHHLRCPPLSVCNDKRCISYGRIFEETLRDMPLKTAQDGGVTAISVPSDLRTRIASDLRTPPPLGIA